jgi:hypothetical protein
VTPGLGVVDVVGVWDLESPLVRPEIGLCVLKGRIGLTSELLIVSLGVSPADSGFEGPSSKPFFVPLNSARSSSTSFRKPDHASSSLTIVARTDARLDR